MDCFCVGVVLFQYLKYHYCQLAPHANTKIPTQIYLGTQGMRSGTTTLNNGLASAHASFQFSLSLPKLIKIELKDSILLTLYQMQDVFTLETQLCTSSGHRRRLPSFS